VRFHRGAREHGCVASSVASAAGRQFASEGGLMDCGVSRDYVGQFGQAAGYVEGRADTVCNPT